MSVTVKAAGQVSKNLDLLRRRWASRMENGCRVVSELLLEKANTLCPKDTHALVDSGGVRKVTGGFNSEFIVGYGSVDFPVPVQLYGKERNQRPPYEYAVYVHEVQIHFLQIPCEADFQELQSAFNKGAGLS